MSNNRASDFRFVPAESFGLQITDNTAKIIFGIDNGPNEREDQVGVVLTLKSLKLLSILTSEAISSLERSGVTVELASDKMEEIQKMFAQQPSDDG